MTQQLALTPVITLAPPLATRKSPQLPTYEADVLMAGGTQAQIVLLDQVYSLRITKAGKLILTK